MKTHNLKTWTVFFKHVKDGTKNFEIRINDRDFQVGDEVNLIEVDPDNDFKPTGDNCKKKISYILHGGNFGIDKDYVVISLSNT